MFDNRVLSGAGLLTLEKLLYMKSPKDSVTSLCEDLLKDEELYMKLISCLTSLVSSENLDPFAMKCFFRTVFLTDSDRLISVLDKFIGVIDSIITMILRITKEGKEQYSYYFFEALAIIMLKLFKRDPNAYKYFSDKINSLVIKVVTSQAQEEMGYGFQLAGFMFYLDSNISDFNMVIYLFNYFYRVYLKI